MSVQRILVLRGGAVGDFILTLPALRAIRERWPGAEITLAGFPRTNGLARGAGLADATVSLDGAWAAALFRAPGAPPGLPAAFDLALSYLHDPAGHVAANLAAAGGGRVRSIPPLPSGGHAADHLLAALTAEGIAAELPAVPRLPVREERYRAGAQRLNGFGRGVWILHPGSGSASKNWPLPCFVGLADRIRAGCGGEVVFTLGEADEALRRDLAVNHPRERALPALPLEGLAGCLAACAGYAGNDSGVTHLAAAVGAPTVALFGPTDPAVWGPRGENVRVLRADPPTVEGLHSLAVDDVVRSVCGKASLSV